jgi:hypothetical protein
MQTEIIPPEEQKNFIDSFWIMMKTCETYAIDTDDPIAIHLVESYFKQWNRVTGDNKKPSWEK